MNPDSVQHINVKVFATANAESDAVVKVFHRWIKDTVCPELLIDVAEYSHVPEGPGVLLIAHEANYSLDNRDNRPGLLYNRKAADEGTFQERLAQAHASALAACDRLEKETTLRFDRNKLEVFINDRALAPNTEETLQALEPELKKYFKNAKLKKVGEPRDLFRVAVSTE
jgi:hypothetical protein